MSIFKRVGVRQRQLLLFSLLLKMWDNIQYATLKCCPIERVLPFC